MDDGQRQDQRPASRCWRRRRQLYTNNFTDIFTVTNTVGTVTNYLDTGATTNFPSRYYRVRLVP